MRVILFVVTAFLAIATVSLPAKAQVFEGRGLRFTGLNLTWTDGTKGDKARYNREWIDFPPYDRKAKTFDFGKPFVLLGPMLGARAEQCPDDMQSMTYSSAGAVHRTMTCPEPEVRCPPRMPCRKNTKMPTTVTYDTTLTREGNTFHLRGKGSTNYKDSLEFNTYALTEKIDFTVNTDGTCKLIDYRKEVRGEHELLEPSPYVKASANLTTVTQSEPGATCDAYTVP